MRLLPRLVCIVPHVLVSILAAHTREVALHEFLHATPGNSSENFGAKALVKNISAVAQPAWVPKVYGRSAFAAKFPRGKVYVELGVYRGEFSQMVWNAAAPSKMVLVDPWKVADNSSVPGVEYKGKTANGESKMAYSKNADMAHVQSTFKDQIASGQVELKRGFSYDFVNDFTPGSIDILYIDACHMYECVRRDMNDYFPKVKLNGYVCGHDYCADGTGGSQPGQCGAMWDNGVTRAVDEFIAQKGAAVEWSFLNPHQNDWCLVRKQ